MPISRLLLSAGHTSRAVISIVAIALAVSACGKGDLIGGSVSGAPTPGTPTPGTPTPGTPSSGNKAPSINGTPPSTVKANQLYDFTPSAFDPNGDPLRFEIAGRPTWASFNANTGRLYGTPPTGTSGTFGGVEIRVTDGLAKAALPVFSIVVLDPQPASSGPAVLSWTRPTQNSDGTALTDLAGYRIYYGQTTSQLTATREITDPSATSTTIDQLAPGTWYFAISSYNQSGVESAKAGPVSITIG